MAFPVDSLRVLKMYQEATGVEPISPEEHMSKKHKHQTNKKSEALNSKLIIFYFYYCND